MNALWQVTLGALWRRKGNTGMIAAVVLVSVAVTIILSGLAARQEQAIEEMIATTRIRCVVTDVYGGNSDNIQMESSYVNKLMGQHHSRGCYLDEYVTDVKALSILPLQEPAGYTARRILSLDSDPLLSAAVIKALPGQEGEPWLDEELWRSEECVCLIPEGAEIWEEAWEKEDGSQWVTVDYQDRVRDLQIIGVVYGGPPDCLFFPFYAKLSDTLSYTSLTQSCSFTIRNNHLLDESKVALREFFVEPDPGWDEPEWRNGLLIQDQLYQESLAELRSGLRLLALLLPLLAGLSCCIGCFSGYLSIRGRMKEFAVMRCLGMRRRKIFGLVFGEQAAPVLLGALVGSLLGIAFDGALIWPAIARGWTVAVAMLVGSGVACLRTTRVNVMKLMKVED